MQEDEMTARAILALWGAGFDTAAIAGMLGIHESRIERFVRVALDTKRELEGAARP